MASPLQIREQLCTIYDGLRHHPNVRNLMQPYLDDAVWHCGGREIDYIPPMMRADFQLED